MLNNAFNWLIILSIYTEEERGENGNVICFIDSIALKKSVIVFFNSSVVNHSPTRIYWNTCLRKPFDEI